MNCLVIAATAFEIKPFLSTFRASKQLADIDIAITGIGLTATSYGLMKQLGIKRPNLIIQAGIGGCFDTNIPLGTVLAVQRETIADLGVVEGKQLISVFDMKFLQQNQPPFSKGWLVNRSIELKKLKLKKVTGISVNAITSSRETKRLYTEKYNPVVESMEGAALHYICLLEKIPFIQIRSVSNYAGERNKKKWRLQESIANLNNELTRLLSLL